MTGLRLSLMPFPGERVSPDVEITVAVARQANVLTIGYTLRGDLAGLVIAAPAGRPFRKDNLWATTCFECFLAAKGSPGYWEFNLSPAGHWNVYRFDDYRQGMREEPTFDSLPFAVVRLPESLSLDLTLDMASLVPPNERIQAACTAVIEQKCGTLTYWAAAHCGQGPDFHRRDSFVVEV